MKQRDVLLTTAALTVLLLALASALISRVRPLAADQSPASATEPPPAAAGIDAATVEALLTQREAGYLSLIQEANRRLSTANDRIAALEQQTQARREPDGNAEAPVYPVSIERATLIALLSFPGARLAHQPELVQLPDTVAYEIALDRGLVYVDATSGELLVTADVTATAPPSGGEHDEDEQHEGNGYDD